jgi:exonuclease III
MNGFSLFKTFLLIVKHNLDIICIQEMWLPQTKIEPKIPGYHILEQRREKGKRGGIAILVRNSLNIIKNTGNQHAQTAQI